MTVTSAVSVRMGVRHYSSSPMCWSPTSSRSRMWASSSA
jgi:hypothetical protein